MEIRHSHFGIRWQAEGRSLEFVSARILRISVWVSILLGAVALLGRLHAAEPALVQFRFGFCSSIFTSVNENDAKASLKVWAIVLAKENGLPVAPDAQIPQGTAALTKAMLQKEVDGGSALTEEYFSVARQVKSSHLFASLINGKTTEEYVLLVQRDAGPKDVKDLKGQTLIVYVNPRMSLASAWLEVVLSDNRLSVVGQHFTSVTRTTKLSKAVLPVFFRQAAACLVTRNGFETMAELNPQVGQQLRVLTSSPPVVPVVTWFSAAYGTPLMPRMVRAVLDMHTTPAGKQVLNIFQSDSIVEIKESALDSARKILADYARIHPSSGDAASTAASLAQGGNRGGDQ